MIAILLTWRPFQGSRTLLIQEPPSTDGVRGFGPLLSEKTLMRFPSEPELSWARPAAKHSEANLGKRR
jgi:hypothetical protein